MGIKLLGTAVRRIRDRVGPSAVPADDDLLGRFASGGDQEAFAALLTRHGPMVWGVCRRTLRHEQDAEDAFQAAFLTLALKASAVRKSAALASWLHGVAYRCALQIRRQSARRQAREHAAGRPEAVSVPADVTEREEFRHALDEELQRLPERYRAAFVLCCLEGKAKTEAARELGWKEGTLSGRLARARRRLQERLTRRGVALSALLTPPALVPATLAGETVRSAVLLAVGKASACAAPAHVTTVVHGVAKTMALAKLKGAALALTLGLAVTASAWFGLRPLGAEPPPDETGKPESRLEPVAKEKQPGRDRFGDPLPEGAVARMGSLRLFHGRQASRVLFSPDGKQVLSDTRGSAGRIRLWEVTSGSEIPLPAGVANVPVYAAANELVVLEWNDAKPRLRKLGEAGEDPSNLALPPMTLDGLSPDGRTLIRAYFDFGLNSSQHVVEFRDVPSGKSSGPFPLGNNGANQTFEIAFSGDSKIAVTRHGGGTVQVWDVPGRKPLRSADLGATGIGFALSPDGTVIATSAQGGKQIRLWDVRTLKELPPSRASPTRLSRGYPSPRTARPWPPATRRRRSGCGTFPAGS
ncbi:MAG TPA: sigma-70 family RNA polymerase sigma factor [Gemmataceae bacterium]